VVRIRLGNVITASILILAAIFFLAPLYIMVVTSFKTPYEVSRMEYLSLPRALYLLNYFKAFSRMSKALLDTLLVTSTSTAICVLIGTAAGYFLASFDFKYSIHLCFITMLASFLPYQAILIPLTVIESFLRLTDTYVGLIFAYVMLNVPLATLIPMAFFLALPRELEEAALIDGCGPIYTFSKVVLPASKPALASTAILVFTSIWNEFLIALTLGGTRVKMVAPVIAELKGCYAALWNLQMAGAVIGSLPPLLFFIVAGKYFVRGLLAGTIRG